MKEWAMIDLEDVHDVLFKWIKEIVIFYVLLIMLKLQHSSTVQPEQQ